MDPHSQWCHKRRCRAYGRIGEGHIVIHSRKERRYRCKRRARTFSETKDSVFYRIHKPKWLVVVVVTLLAYGCPVHATVAAFGIDERTVAAGKGSLAHSAGGCMSTLSKQGGLSFYRCRPTNFGSKRSEGSTGWPVLWR